MSELDTSAVMPEPVICALIGTSIVLGTAPVYLSYFNSRWKQFKRWWNKNKYVYKTLSANQTQTFYILCAYLSKYCKSNMYLTTDIDFICGNQKQVFTIPDADTCIKFFNKDRSIEIEIIVKSLDKINVHAFEIVVKKEYEEILHNELKPLYISAGYDIICIKEILYKANFTEEEENKINIIINQRNRMREIQVQQINNKLQEEINNNKSYIDENS